MYTAVKKFGKSSSYIPYRNVSLKTLWEKQVGRNLKECAHYGCEKEADVVDYVYIGSKNHEYIVPLCELCSMKGNELYVNAYDLVKTK